MRLFTNVVLFMVLARHWSVETFGLFVYLTTTTILLTLIVDYGYAQQLLREIGQEPKRVRKIVSEAFATKLVLAILLIGLSIIIVPLTSAKSLTIELFLILLFASIFNSFGEFFNVAFRSLGRFHTETRVVTLNNLLHFGIVSLLAYVGYGPIVVAWGFVLSKAIYLCMSYQAYRQNVGELERVSFAIADIWKSLTHGFYYCVDAALTIFYSNLDTLIVFNMLGPVGVGVYQAGLRLVLGANTFTQVLGSVYMPLISAKIYNETECSRLLRSMYLSMLLIGGSFCLIFIIGAKPIVSIMYGSKFTDLAPLFPYFGLLLFFRYIASAHGVTLSAAGLQKTRVYFYVLSTLSLFITSYCIVPTFGLKGMIVSSIISMAVLHTLFALKLIREKISLGIDFKNSIITILTIAVIAIAFIKI